MKKVIFVAVLYVSLLVLCFFIIIKESKIEKETPKDFTDKWVLKERCECQIIMTDTTTTWINREGQVEAIVWNR